MDKKQYMAPEAEILSVLMERCVLSYDDDEQGHPSVEDAHYRDGRW